MKPCTICGEFREDLELERSPSGSGKLLCADCAGEVELDLAAMRDEYAQELLDDELEK